MNNLIYYPSFEVRDESWLKLALLYFDNIHLIIPSSADGLLSDQFRQIESCVNNPFKTIRPEKHDVNTASRDAAFEIENILRFPERYNADFEITGNETVVDKWKNRNYQLFEIFNEKFAMFFKDFCIHNELAHESKHGIKVSRELADIFMALLAKSLGDQRSLSPITDIPRIDDISNKICLTDKPCDSVELGFKIVDLYLPKNIDKIPLQTIINYRNTPKFTENLNGFQSVINEIYQTIKVGTNEEDTIPLMRRYEDASRIFNKNLLRLSGELVKVGIGCWIASTNPITIPIGAGLAVDGLLGIDSLLSVKKQWGYSKQKIRSNRFVTGVRKLI